MSARITVSVTPDFASETIWSTVIADASRGTGSPSAKQPRISGSGSGGAWSRPRATKSASGSGGRNPKETKGYAIRTVDSQPGHHSFGGDSPRPWDLISFVFPRTYGRRRSGRRVHRLPLDRLVQGVCNAFESTRVRRVGRCVHRCGGGRRLSGDTAEHGADADVGAASAGRDHTRGRTRGAPQTSAAASAKPVQETEAVVGDAIAAKRREEQRSARSRPRRSRAPRPSHRAPAIPRRPSSRTRSRSPRCPMSRRRSRLFRPRPHSSRARPAPRAEDRAAQEPARAPEPPAHMFAEYWSSPPTR